jgi:hypothetical protein
MAENGPLAQLEQALETHHHGGLEELEGAALYHAKPFRTFA